MTFEDDLDDPPAPSHDAKKQPKTEKHSHVHSSHEPISSSSCSSGTSKLHYTKQDIIASSTSGKQAKQIVPQAQQLLLLYALLCAPVYADKKAWLWEAVVAGKYSASSSVSGNDNHEVEPTPDTPVSLPAEINVATATRNLRLHV